MHSIAIASVQPKSNLPAAKVPKSRPFSWSLIASALLLASVAGQAQISGNHYPMGAEGIKNASLPPKGVFTKNYNLFYHSDTLKDGAGNTAPVNFDVFAYVNATRVFYFPDVEFLGGKVGADFTVPIVHTELTVGGARFSETGLGDILIEPLLIGWHYPQLDLALGYGVWAPTGEWSAAQPASPGKGYWSHMIPMGATLYLDKERTWAFSTAHRFEFHTRRSDGITPGINWNLEWGLSKAIQPTLELGVVGYGTKQLTHDSAGPRARDMAFGVGPEVDWLWTKYMLHFAFRYYREFAVSDRPAGGTGLFVLTKIW